MPQKSAAALLTKTQREWLSGEDKPTHERELRGRLYERIRLLIREDAELIASSLDDGTIDPSVIMRDMDPDELRQAISACTMALYILGDRGVNIDVEKAIGHGLKQGKEGELAALRERLENDPGSLTLSELVQLRTDRETRRDPELSEHVQQYFTLALGKPDIGRVAPDTEIDLEDISE